MTEPETEILGAGAPSLSPFTEGRDELNLVELPFTLLTADNRTGTQRIEKRWVENGREMWYVVAANPEFGMPTCLAEMVYVAAQELTFRQEPPSPEVHTTKADLLGIMGWHDNGHYRRQLEACFGQLQGTVIHTNFFYDRQRRTFLPPNRTAFSVIQAFQFFQEERRRGLQMGLPLSWFTWNDVLWQSLQAGFVKRLNTTVYYDLSSPTARKLYRVVDKWIYHGHYEVDLALLAAVKLGMSEYDRPSRIKQKLSAAVRELNERGLARLRIEPAKDTESGFKFIVEAPHVMRPLGTGTPPAGAASSARRPPSPPAQLLIDSLVGRGLNERTAARLAAKRGAQIPLLLEVFDFLCAQPRERPLGTGYLTRMLDEGWYLAKPPAGFRSAAQRQEETETRQALLEEYAQARACVRLEVEEWAALPAVERIDRDALEDWEKSLRRREQRDPTARERARVRELLVHQVPSPEEELERRLAPVREDLQRRAQQAGIGPLELPA